MNKYRCPICKKEYLHSEGMYHHVHDEHEEMLQGMSPKQYCFNAKYKYTGRTGRSVLTGKPTQWNEHLGKYERFADDKEKEQYRQIFLARMQKTYGKDTLLNDPDVQKKMLANRKISGTYKMKDGKDVTYTGEYEHHFLETMDGILEWPSCDLFIPAPQVIHYMNPRTKKSSFYIPDAYIASLNLIVEIKSEDNKHYRERDLDIEKAKDKETLKQGFPFIKVYDKNYAPLLNTIMKLKEDSLADGDIYD
jgi:hypothetical protein